MAKENNPQQQTNVQIPEIYANTAISNFSPYEFELTLGLASSNYEGVRPVVNVRISPQFAKELARILTNNVALYEEHVMQIPVMKEQKKK